MTSNSFTETEIRILKQICVLFNDNKIVKKFKLDSLMKLKKSFSPREIKTIQLICDEYTSEEIADKLGLSKRSADAIRGTLLIETKSKNTVGLVKYAIKHGIYILK